MVMLSAVPARADSIVAVAIVASTSRVFNKRTEIVGEIALVLRFPGLKEVRTVTVERYSSVSGCTAPDNATERGTPQ